jgi:hypothetical protein
MNRALLAAGLVDRLEVMMFRFNYPLSVRQKARGFGRPMV